MMFRKPKICIIVAMDRKSGIGKGGQLPWRLKGDMEHFRTITIQTKNPQLQNMVIMGRKTLESLPEKSRPLRERKNVVITRTASYQADGAIVCHSLKEALRVVSPDIETIFIIGGGELYRQALQELRIDGIYLTRIDKDYGCDTFFPTLPQYFRKMKLLGSGEERGVKYEFLLFQR